MRTQKASSQIYGAQTTKYGRVAAAALIMALILITFAGISPVAADGDGIENGINTDAARYQAMGEYYSANDADSARWAALGSFYAQESASPYTDVAKFYSERMRAQADESSTLAANPELMIARRSYSAADGLLAANPELMVARRSYGTGDGLLAANPELSVARQYIQGFASCSFSDDERLAANPELVNIRQASTC